MHLLRKEKQISLNKKQKIRILKDKIQGNKTYIMHRGVFIV